MKRRLQESEREKNRKSLKTANASAEMMRRLGERHLGRVARDAKAVGKGSTGAKSPAGAALTCKMLRWNVPGVRDAMKKERALIRNVSGALRPLFGNRK